MMTVKKLRRRPASFLRLSGLSVERLDEVMGSLKAAYGGFNHQRQVSIPLRASKLHPLTRAQNRYNRGLARQRVAVEHALACVKKYRVIGALYRHALSQYDAVLRTVCGLVNLRTSTRLEAA